MWKVEKGDCDVRTGDRYRSPIELESRGRGRHGGEGLILGRITDSLFLE